MRIAVINPSLRPDAHRRILPVGLAYVMSAMELAGFDFDLIDMDINNYSSSDLEAILGQKVYDVYATGCIVTGLRYIKQIAGLAKQNNPESVVIAGNSVATSIPEILLQNTQVDVAVMGEGDRTIVDLLHTLERGEALSKVKGIAFKTNDGDITFTPERPLIRDLDDIGFPNWNLFDLDEYYKYGQVNTNYSGDKDALSFPLNAARGCPYRCTFCYHVFKGKRYRKYSENAVVEEIQRLHNQYGCTYISFWDELTFPNIKSVERLVAQIEGLDFDIGWEAVARGDLFGMEHVDLIRAMKSAGCDNIAFSLENASPEILEAMNKRLEVSQFVEQSHALWEGGVVPMTSVIFGYPQETPETIRQTIEVCAQANVFPSVGFLLPLPGTPIYDWAVENGHIADPIAYLMRIGDRQDFHINLTSMPDEELIETVENGLLELAKAQGLELESVFKTVTYQVPEKQ